MQNIFFAHTLQSSDHPVSPFSIWLYFPSLSLFNISCIIFYSLFIFLSYSTFLPLPSFFIPFSHLYPASFSLHVFCVSHNQLLQWHFRLLPTLYSFPSSAQLLFSGSIPPLFLPHWSFIPYLPLLVLLQLIMQVEGLWPAHPQGDPPSTLSGTWGSSTTRIWGCVQGGTPPLSWRQ